MTDNYPLYVLFGYSPFHGLFVEVAYLEIVERVVVSFYHPVGNGSVIQHPQGSESYTDSVRLVSSATQIEFIVPKPFEVNVGEIEVQCLAKMQDRHFQFSEISCISVPVLGFQNLHEVVKVFSEIHLPYRILNSLHKCFEGVVLALYLELGYLLPILLGLAFDYGENGITVWAIPFRCVLLEVPL